MITTPGYHFTLLNINKKIMTSNKWFCQSLIFSIVIKQNDNHRSIILAIPLIFTFPSLGEGWYRHEHSLRVDSNPPHQHFRGCNVRSKLDPAVDERNCAGRNFDCLVKQHRYVNKIIVQILLFSIAMYEHKRTSKNLVKRIKKTQLAFPAMNSHEAIITYFKFLSFDNRILNK